MGKPALCFNPCIALAAGMVGVAGWSPVGWWPLALLAYGLLFYLVTASRNGTDALYTGLGFGIGLHALGHAWITHPLDTLLGLGMPATLLCRLLLVGFASLFTALPCMAAKYLMLRAKPGAARQKGTGTGAQPWAAAAIFAAFITLGEWLRGLTLDGFTSLSLGDALVETWYAGYAPVFGLYGVGLAGLASAALILLVAGEPILRRPALALLACLAVTGLLLREVAWVEPAGEALSFRLLQSDIRQETKFDPAYRQRHVEHLIELVGAHPAQLILTSETAFPLYFSALPGSALSRMRSFSADTDSHLFLGMPTLSSQGDGYNSIVHLPPGKGAMAQYNKTTLMPVGEYSPFGLGWLSERLNIPFKNLSPGAEAQALFQVGPYRIGALICQEESTGRTLRRRLPEAQLLINPSNLAWFDGTAAPAQRLQSVQMRALEGGRPILRITSSGLTAHIDHRGRILDSLPERREGTLAGQVVPMSGSTPYVWWGDWPILAGCILCLLLLAGMPSRLAKRQKTARAQA